MNWTQQIANCIEHDSKRRLLKGIPLWLIATVDYTPDFVYWLEFRKSNTN